MIRLREMEFQTGSFSTELMSTGTE